MNTAPRTITTALAAYSLLLIIGCSDAPELSEDPIESDTFVSVMASLSQIRQFPPAGTAGVDREARADSMREAILREHGITADQLLEFAEKVGEDPDRMVALAERIAEVSDSMAALRDPPEPIGAMDVEVASETARSRPLPDAVTDEKQGSLRGRLDSLRQEFGRPAP